MKHEFYAIQCVAVSMRFTSLKKSEYRALSRFISEQLTAIESWIMGNEENRPKYEKFINICSAEIYSDNSPEKQIEHIKAALQSLQVEKKFFFSTE